MGACGADSVTGRLAEVVCAWSMDMGGAIVWSSQSMSFILWGQETCTLVTVDARVKFVCRVGGMRARGTAQVLMTDTVICSCS